MFYSPPPRQELAVRGEHRHPQVHRCSTQPSEKPLGRRPLKFFKNLRSARCAQERPPLCISGLQALLAVFFTVVRWPKSLVFSHHFGGFVSAVKSMCLS